MTKRNKTKKGAVKRKKTTKAHKPRTFREWLPYITVIAVVSMVALWPTVHSDFTELDDKKLILENLPRFMDYPSLIWKYSLFTAHYKPLVFFSWLLEARIYGVSAVGFHFVNLLFHTFNSILVFFLAFNLSRQFRVTKGQPELVALFTALFFAVHPMHVESVAWAMGRKDLFYAFFFLLGVLAYIRHLAKPSVKWMSIVVLCFLGSILSKAPAVMFPFVLILIDYAYGKEFTIKAITSKWPIFATLLFGLFIFGVFGTDPNVVDPGKIEGRITQIFNTSAISNLHPLNDMPALYAKSTLYGFKGVFWYLHALVPIKLALAYPYKHWLPEIGHGIHIFLIVIAVAQIGLVLVRYRYRFLFFTHSLFFISLMPALIRTGLGKGVFLSDRYVYLPLFGIVFFISGAFVYLMVKKKWPQKRMYVVMGGITLLLSGMSFIQAKKWDTAETLWTHNIKHYPQVAYAYSNRGLYYQEIGQTEKALADFSSAAAIEDDIHALIGKATILRKQGRYDEAMADLDKILTREPDNQYALNGKANVFFAQQRYQDAVNVYSTGLQAYPRDLDMLANRAAANFYLRQYDAALADLNKAERINPDYPGLYSKMTVVYSGIQDWNNVIKYASLYAQQQPGNHANLGDLGNAYQRVGRHQEAIDAYTQAIGVFPNGKRYYNGRARSYRALENTNAADRDQAKADIL